MTSILDRRLCAVMVALSVTVVSAGAEPTTKPAIAAIAVVPDGQAVVYGSQAGVVCRSLVDASERAIPTQLDHVCALAFSPNGRCLAVAGGSPAEAGAVEVFSWPDRKRSGRLEGHTDIVHGVAWLPDSRQLVTASADRSVRLWDVSSGKCLATLAGHSGPVLALAVSPDGKWLCSGSADHTIRVWSTDDRRLVRSLNNHLGTVHGLAFRPQVDGLPCLASASQDGTVRIWQPSIGRMVRIVRHPAPVFGVAWDRSGTHLNTGGMDGCLRRVDGDSDAILRTWKLDAGRVSSLAVGADGSRHVGHVNGVLSRVVLDQK